MILKLEKDFFAHRKNSQFLVKSLQKIQSCQKNTDTYLCQGRQTTWNDLERWLVIHKLCKLEFIPAKEHLFIIGPN
jgi:hypothetical protein